MHAQIHGNTSSPVLVYKVDPEYTAAAARQASIEGDVLVEGTVDTKGHIVNIRVARSLGYGLDDKAVECVRKWRFKPAMKPPQSPIEAKVKLPVEFRLSN